jgi:uncharacterized Ntn-hydrolase superfamily protein
MSPRTRFPALVAACALLSAAALVARPGPEPAAGTPAASLAILARDPLTGEYGVAAASNAPLIGLNLDFLDPDVGGVVVLGGPFLEINEKTLIALRDGLPPARAIAVGLATDPEPERRQVLAISAAGSAAYTGKGLAGHAGDTAGDDFVAAGHNLGAGADVIQGMERSFAGSEGALADRLLAALAAARDAGGEKDGARSAALLVVGPGARFATRGRLVDLRIDYVPGDAVAALVELRAHVDSVYEITPLRAAPPPR